MRSSARATAVPIQNTSSIRIETAKEIQEFLVDWFNKNSVELISKNVSLNEIENTVREIEEAIYINTVIIMIQSSDASFTKIYKSFFSNLKFNLIPKDLPVSTPITTTTSTGTLTPTGGIVSPSAAVTDLLIKRILTNPTSTLNSIITTGPLELNKDLVEIQDLQRQEEKDLERGIGLSANAVNVLCATCKGTKMHNFERQTRSSDEAATQYYICLNPECKKYGEERRYAIKIRDPKP